MGYLFAVMNNLDSKFIEHILKILLILRMKYICFKAFLNVVLINY